jgi:hypothetical protein
MKKKIRRRRCKNCHDLFISDPRNLKRQKFCIKPECKIASKKHSQRKWLNKTENRNYFSSPENVIRVQQWREQNLGYWRRKKPVKNVSLFEDAFQDKLLVKMPDCKGSQANLMQNALQDILSSKSLVFIGFTPHLNENALKILIDITAQGDIMLK